MKGASMYKVICPIDNEIKWQTKDRKEAIAQAIEFLQREYESNELDEPSEYGYRVNVEIFKKGKPRF